MNGTRRAWEPHRVAARRNRRNERDAVPIVGEAGGERRSYLVGLALSAVLMTVPFALVVWRPLDRGWTIAAIALFAIAQVVVQFRYFLHIDLSASKREDLQLILFAALVIAIMVGGGLIVMASMHMRMMAM